jgi:hypothetical protein
LDRQDHARRAGDHDGTAGRGVGPRPSRRPLTRRRRARAAPRTRGPPSSSPTNRPPQRRAKPRARSPPRRRRPRQLRRPTRRHRTPPPRSTTTSSHGPSPRRGPAAAAVATSCGWRSPANRAAAVPRAWAGGWPRGRRWSRTSTATGRPSICGSCSPPDDRPRAWRLWAGGGQGEGSSRPGRTCDSFVSQWTGDSTPQAGRPFHEGPCHPDRICGLRDRDPSVRDRQTIAGCVQRRP